MTESLRNQGDNYQWNAYAVIIMAAALRMIYLQSGFLDLIPDEAYYWTWSQRIAVCYHTKGPVIAWIIRLTTTLSGDTPFAVRIGAVLCTVVGSVAAFHLTVALFKSHRAGFLAVIMITCAPLFAIGAILMTPDTPLFCFWVLSLLYLVRGLEGKRPRPWFLLGLTMGLGILTKYTMLVFPVLMIGYIAATPEHRHWLKKSGPWTAIILALLTCVPLIAWNAAHDWIIISHLTGRGGLTRPEWGLNPAKIGDNVIGQIAVIGPFFLALCLVPLLRLKQWYRESGNPALLLIAWFSLPILGFFALLGLFKKVEPNWTVLAYLPLMLLAAAWWSRESVHGWKNRLAVWGSVVVTALLVLVLHLPTITQFVGFTLPPNLDPLRRFQGWSNLATPVEDMLAGHEAGSVFLLAENQHIASELAFYLDALDITFVQPYNQRHTQFDFWPGPNTQIGKNAIYVAQSDEDLPRQLRDAFESIEPPSLVRILQGGKLLRRFTIYECAGFRGFPESR